MIKEEGRARLKCYLCGHEWEDVGVMEVYNAKEQEYLRGIEGDSVFYASEAGKGCPECSMGDWGFLWFEGDGDLKEV